MKIRNKNGQAAAVGAMITFMVVLLVFSIVMLYYVPVLLKDKEIQHMREVERGFMELSSAVTSLILNDDKTTTPKIAIQLGVEGIPLLAQGNMGTLAVEPWGASMNVYNDAKKIDYSSFGTVKFTSQNRYYTRQNYIYELGALFAQQSDNISMKAPPEINLNDGKLTITLISIEGTNQTISGWGSEALLLKLQYCASITHTLSNENITINITSANAKAWQKCFERYSNISATLGNGCLAVTFIGIKKLEVKFAAIKLSVIPA
ncbi:MAG: hypothetical protein QMD21_04610 [Candidatus Thermoplasmatota archaeon]|nr:hypothetical protein [Candidatus Thermoplasmatota archaeon]